MIITPQEHNVLFEAFPREGYRDDVEAIRPTTLARYGEQEWRAITLTAEMHGHLGIYAVLGCKMGLAALEHPICCEAPLRILSYAGAKPPVSCLNDGLQVATGSTLGHGQIELSSEGPARPMALFIQGDRRLRLRLKPAFDQLLTESLEEVLLTTGNRTSAYWSAMRRLALEWWREWDRHKIFVAERLDGEKDFG